MESEVKYFRVKKFFLVINVLLMIAACIYSGINVHKTQDPVSTRLLAGSLGILYLLFLFGIWREHICLTNGYATLLILQIIGCVVYFVLGYHWLDLAPPFLWCILLLIVTIYYVKDLRIFQYSEI